jgi:hypothetical protein
MTLEQQHHIRNGIISIQTIHRWLLQNTSLSAVQRLYLEEAQAQAARIEAACLGECSGRNERFSMKRILLIGLIVVLVLSACATLGKQTPPAGCEKSVIYQYAPWSFVVLTGAVDGLYVMAQTNPAQYQAARQAARQAEVILEGQTVTYGQLQGVPGLAALLTSQLATIFRPDQVLDACDKQVLLGYLRML